MTTNRRARRLLTILGLGWTCTRLISSGQKAMLPQTVYTTFRQLGGVYVKFLQLLVIRSEAFQSLRDYDIYDVYDQVATEPIDVQNLLIQDLGKRADDINLVSDVPFAAGSFGQVYLGYYQGKQVVIKVLRPTVIRDLKFDLRLLSVFSRLINSFSGSSPVNSKLVFKEFAKTTMLETNYILEADAASTLYERFRNHPNIVIPYTYRQLSTERIICQDYIDGVAATSLIKATRQGIDAKAYVAQNLSSNIEEQLIAVGSEMLTGAFLYGTTYGDPHPGNIIFMRDNRIGLIDFGLQASAPSKTLNFRRLIEEYYKIYSGHPDIRGYSKALLDMYGGDIIRAAYCLDEYYSTSSHNLLDSIVGNAEQIINSQRDQLAGIMQNNKMALLFNSVVNKNNRFCLEYDLDGPELIRAANLFISLLTSLGVKMTVLQQTYGLVLERTKDLNLSANQPVLHPETAFEILADWFDQISYKNPQLYRQIKRMRLNYV